MPVDPHLAGFLALLEDAAAPPMWETTPEVAREQFRALTVLARRPDQVPEVGSVTDRLVPGADGDLPARVYRPEGTGPFPTVVFFHGGGWVIGDLDTHDTVARLLCRESQSVVVSVDYRLAPAHPFPAAPDDAVASASWVAAHLDEFGGSDRLGLAGDSAGGNLAAVAAQALEAHGVPVAAQFLIYPSVDVAGRYPSMTENGKGYFLDEPTMAWFGSHYVGEGTEPADPKLSPMRGPLEGVAPAVVVTAEFDPLRDEGEAYGDALRAAGGSADVRRRAGMIHGYFNMTDFSPAARALVEEDCAAFGALLRA